MDTVPLPNRSNFGFVDVAQLEATTYVPNSIFFSIASTYVLNSIYVRNSTFYCIVVFKKLDGQAIYIPL